jgi:hypothetical protein
MALFSFQNAYFSDEPRPVIKVYWSQRRCHTDLGTEWRDVSVSMRKMPAAIAGRNGTGTELGRMAQYGIRCCPTPLPAASQRGAATIGLIFVGALSAFLDQDR